MTDNKTDSLDLYKIYLATAEKVSDRRAAANSWMLSINSAIVGLYGYLQTGKEVVGGAEKSIWLWAIPAAGSLVCLSWAVLLRSYRQLNAAKFKVLQEIEKRFSIPLFKRESEAYSKLGRTPLSWVEGWVPCTFIALYLVMIAAVFSG